MTAGIQECIFRLDLQRIYLVTNFEKDKKYVYIVEENKENKFKVLKVGLDGHSFQVDTTNENRVYFIHENFIYNLEFKEEKSDFTSFLNKGIAKMIDSSKKGKHGEKNTFGAEEFFESKTNLQFLRFENSMKVFYCDDERVIKQYSSITKETMHVYDDVVALCTDLQLSNNEKLIYR